MRIGDILTSGLAIKFALIVFIIIISSNCSGAKLETNEVQLTNNDLDEWDPKISEYHIVWEENANIVCYNRTTNEIEILSPNATSVGSLEMDENYIFWIEGVGTNYSAILYDTQNESREVIFPDRYIHRGVITGDNQIKNGSIIFTKFNTTNWYGGLYIYDIATEKTDEVYVGEFAVNYLGDFFLLDNYIVYELFSNETDVDIYCYNIENQDSYPIFNSTFEDKLLFEYGNTVLIFTQDYDLRVVYNVSSNSSFPIYHNHSATRGFGSNFLIYQNRGRDLYVYEYMEQEEYFLTWRSFSFLDIFNYSIVGMIWSTNSTYDILLIEFFFSDENVKNSDYNDDSKYALKEYCIMASVFVFIFIAMVLLHIKVED